MPYVLGIDIGTTSIVAAIARRRDVVWTRPEVTELEPGRAAVPSILGLSPDGVMHVGTAAWAQTGTDPREVVSHFLWRVGDDVPLILHGEACPAPALAAVLVSWVVERVTEREREPPERIVLSRPAAWGSYRSDLLNRALDEIGLHRVTILSKAVTVAEAHAARGFTGRTAALYCLGGASFESCLVRRSHGVFEQFGPAQRLERVGGDDFDDALAEHVHGVLHRDLADSAGPRVRPALAALTDECERTKRELSMSPQADVVVRLPGGTSRIPVTRARFAELIRPAIDATMNVLVHTIRSAGLTADQIDGILLAGGSARIPLVTELLAARFPDRVAIETNPQATAAIGAALVASQLLSPRRTPRRATTRRLTADGDDGGPDPAEELTNEQTGWVDPPARPEVHIQPLELPKSIWLRGGLTRRPAPRQRQRQGVEE